MSSFIKVVEHKHSIFEAPKGSTLVFMCGYYGWSKDRIYKLLKTKDSIAADQYIKFAETAHTLVPYKQYIYATPSHILHYYIVFMHVDIPFNTFQTASGQATKSISEGFIKLLRSYAVKDCQVWLLKDIVEEYNIAWQDIRTALQNTATTDLKNTTINVSTYN